MTTPKTVIRGAHVISIDPQIGEIAGGDVLIEGRHIAAVGRSIEAADAQVVDASAMIALPGFVDTHRHTWQALIRNIASDWTLAQYFAGVRGVLGRTFRPQDNYAGTLVGVLESLDSGITTLLDWSHNMNTPEHADETIRAHQESGSRVVLAYGNANDEWLPVSSIPHSRDCVRLRAQYFNSDDQLITLAMALRGPQFATMDVTEHDWKLAREIGARISVHVGDGLWGLDKPLVQLDQRGLLGSDTTYVHCNSLHDDDLRLMADSGGSASVAPELEMHMGHGDVATGRLLAHGIRPSLSIDVVTSIGGDMFGAMRACLAAELALQNKRALDARRVLDPLPLMTSDALEFATIEGARACGLADKVGSLTPGKEADLILIDTDQLNLMPMNNARGGVVMSAHPGNVDSVWVAGRRVKQDGRLVGVDLAALRRTVEDSRDHVFAAAGAAIGGDWLPRPYDGTPAA
ncbi:MAG TPA: amidohydrolase family protein [Candidatus Limnocylindria bacterium]|nr:amidohydrolase family protein [Candidatus Limnocylindria bacterium]